MSRAGFGGLGLSLVLSGLAHAVVLGLGAPARGWLEPVPTAPLVVRLERAGAEVAPAIAASIAPAAAPSPGIPLERPARASAEAATRTPARPVSKPAPIAGRREPAAPTTVPVAAPARPVPQARPAPSGSARLAAAAEPPSPAVAALAPPANPQPASPATPLPAEVAATRAAPAGAARERLLALLNREISASQRYPRVARRQGREGRVRVRFELYPDGRVESVDVIDSSRFAPLDLAARRAVADIAPFAPAADYLDQAESFQVEVRFALR